MEKETSSPPPNNHDDDLEHGASSWHTYLPIFISAVLFFSGLILEHRLAPKFFTAPVPFVWYLLAYLPVAFPVLAAALRKVLRGDIFNEFFLMSIATIGAFAIGEYPEGVGVMLFYAVGELLQAAAVQKARGNIEKLLDVAPKEASVLRNQEYISTSPQNVQIGEQIQVLAGQQVPLDATLLSPTASLNTAALTGESKPRSILKGDAVLAGSINLQQVIELKVDKAYQDSSIARLLYMVQHATARKSQTERLIRKLARYYTPIVVYLALAIFLLPYFFVAEYHYQDWLYRALIFLVISCPCALVISIPLGYFGGIGAASKQGILFKGANYLDLFSRIHTLVLDKTGTLTKGVFKIKQIVTLGSYSEKEFMQLLMSLEQKSTHPIALAIRQYPLSGNILPANEVIEIAGKGLSGMVDGKRLLAGNKKLMEHFGIPIPKKIGEIVQSIVLLAVNEKLIGYTIIADELKEDAKKSIQQIRSAGVRKIIMLSGDKNSITQYYATQLKLDAAKGDLLPEDKLNEVEVLKKQNPENILAFVGDGINDAPVLARSDIGIAMGNLGSDLAIETADVILQTDQPSRIATGIQISKATQNIIWQNIGLALGIKVIVLILGAFGMATMWQAVFADVGVALLAILNAVRLQRLF